MNQHLLAAITNPALPAALQNSATPTAAAGVLGVYIAVLWRTAITLGGLAVIIYLLVGGFYWITASGDKGKVEEAKERIMQAIIGFAVLSAAAAVSVFLGQVFGLDLLQPNFEILNDSGSTGAKDTGTPDENGGKVPAPQPDGKDAGTINYNMDGATYTMQG